MKLSDDGYGSLKQWFHLYKTIVQVTNYCTYNLNAVKENE